ncbi:MAG: integrase [Micavibrio aeruginosavorus]|uniref:Integrase n=1 Tax=Micavibrio aeruginosavorus TaxID=349221 RepID=A0A2W5FR11_9BACT|nr:MAG: integrase [Micavibrio aeruginosavorus]
MPLTELAIKNMKPKEKAYRVADSNGLCIEISPKGSKLWRWRFYYLGKPQMAALGKYPAIPLAQARKLRDEARAVLESGKHPTLYKRAQRLRKAMEGNNTFERIARLWIETKQKGLNEKYVRQNLERLEQLVFPAIGALPITEITIPDVVRVVDRIANRGTIETAKRMKQLIGQVFRYAATRGLCEHNPASDLRGILPAKEASHHASLPIGELPELLKAIETREPDFSKYAMQLLALTFVRTGELIGARWSEIDWDREEWHIPKERMKMKRAHIVPLSRQALEIFRELQKRTGDRLHVFHSPASKSKHISNGTVLMALRRMGYAGKMTGHGWRSIASSILYEKNYKPEAIEAQLAHTDPNEVRSAYNYKATYMLERKKMMQDYADWLESIGRSGIVIIGNFG